MITTSDTIIKFNTFNTDGNVFLQIIAKNIIEYFKIKITERSTNRIITFNDKCNGEILEYSFKIENCLLWGVTNPNLYDYELYIKYYNGEETVQDYFAFRTLTVKDNDVLLNGKPIFIRGYIRGAKAHEHSNNCNLSMCDFYSKNIQMAKKYGFNFVRFHSIVPDDDFFKEADRLGLLVHIELRLPTDSYNNLTEMVGLENHLISNDFIKQTIDKLYNHPSLAVYCIGNEIKNDSLLNRINEIGKLIKEYDSTRLYIDTCAWGKINRNYVDIDVQHMGYYFPYGKHSDMFNNANSIHTLKTVNTNFKNGENPYKIPLIAHEVCHYTALRDFNCLKQKFNKYNDDLPWWIDEELKMIQFKSGSFSYDEMYEASKHFQLQCWKVAFENLRLSKLLSGFHFLQFADTDVYENSNGVVDCFDDENYVTPEMFLPFNKDLILLSSLQRKLFTSEEEIETEFYLSNYCEDTLNKASLTYSIQDNEKKYFTKTVDGVNISCYGVIPICKAKIKMPSIVNSKKLLLKVTLKDGNKLLAENEWSIWLFKNQDKVRYCDFVNYDINGVLITDDIKSAIDGIKQKKKVCLIYRSMWTRHVANKNMQKPEYAFKATWNRFKPVIWDRGTNFGGLCDKELLNKYGFPTDKFYDFNYSIITEDCDKIVLDDFPIKVKSLISGIDKNVRDRFDVPKTYFNLSELQYDRTLRNFSYLFECKVDDSPLLVCGLNLTGVDENEPSSICMANAILKYLNSEDFNPSNKITLVKLIDYMKKCAERPIKERMMTQFWELDDSPVETKEYWKESKEYLND